ncbi:MAG TPA: DUF4215 domain-containing protein [Candidatus Binatia bacterium]|nr:DUF4215 domain-containing protein [Candidatus Binatia bacterium]
MRQTLALLTALLAPVVPALAAPAPPDCTAEYLVPDDGPLIDSVSPPQLDAITIDGTSIGIRSGCPVTQAKILGKRGGGAKVRARWSGCGADRKIRLRATLSANCGVLEGRVLMKRKPKKTFLGRPSRCGDGIVDTAMLERCEPPDMGNCDPFCRQIVPIPARCGNGIVDPGEQCDDGNLVSGDGCNDCLLPRCGDRVKDPGEDCDDGNTDDTDACTNACRLRCGGGSFTSTWDAIQLLVFHHKQCTNPVCHGVPAVSGGLNLQPDVAYASIIDVPSTIDPNVVRIKPGDETQSMLWLKLAARTLGTPVVGSPMPLEADPSTTPLSTQQLEAMKLWIRAGAPNTGVIDGTADLLNACLGGGGGPTTPPPPPAVDAGIRLHAPPWVIPPLGEDEVCFSTYYDFEAQIQQNRPDALLPCPAEWGGPTKQCFAYKGNDLTQDPNSHHSLIRAYRGIYPATHSGFGAYTCHGGANDGVACNPLAVGVPAPAGAECGDDSGCAGAVRSTIACNAYGPPDFGFTGSVNGNDTAPTIGGSQAPRATTTFVGGSFGLQPAKGIIVWNSHAFNLGTAPATNQQWFDLFFAGPSERQYPVIFLADDSQIFIANVPPFETREYCNNHVMEQGARIFELSTHFHKRGKIFRIWDPSGALVLTTTNYADPTVKRYDPPVALDDPDPLKRTYRYCALYDNGATNPAEVKRKSTSPDPPLGIPLGGPCTTDDVRCMAGPRKGQRCFDDDRQCDSTVGAADGDCDACPLLGGVTTEDEMFILIGTYFIVP